MNYLYRQLILISLLLLLTPERSDGQTAAITGDEPATVTSLELQLSEQERKVKILGIVSFLLVGGGLIPMGLYLFYQRRKQKQLSTQLTALRNQINPHFFSNSLNAIESLVNLDQKRAASKYLIHFSRLTRRLLNTTRHTMSSLAGELETVKHFLALEQLRFKDKLHYGIRIAEDLQPALLAVPALVFQPFLENAIWHGIKPKEEAGFLQFSVSREGNQLCCVIEDDGIGRSAACQQQQKSVMQHESTGGRSTKKQLRTTGSGAVETIDLFDEEGRAIGTKVIIRLPYKTYQV